MSESGYKQDFIGFIFAQALLGDRDAKRVVGYCKRKDNKNRLEGRIASRVAAGSITAEWCAELFDTLDKLQERYDKSPKLIDCREPGDWIDLGANRRMHVKHIEPSADDLRVEGVTP